MNYKTYIEILASEVQRPFDAVIQKIAGELVIANRETLIRQKYDKDQTLPANALISTCFPTESVNPAECCGIDWVCDVVRTAEIPVPIDLGDALMFNYLGPIKPGSLGWGRLKPDEVGLIKHRKFTKHLTYVVYLNRRLYVINKPALESLGVRYIPANPLELAAMTNCSGKPCFDLDNANFIEGHWEETLTKMVLPKLKEILGQQIQVDDERN